MRFLVAATSPLESLSSRPRPRCQRPPTCELQLVPPGGIGQLLQLNAVLELSALAVVGGVAFLLGSPDSPLWGLFPHEDETEADALMTELCRSDGWAARCQITGRPGLRMAEPSRGIGLDLTVAFTQGEGRCSLLRSSRFLNQAGRWRIDAAAYGAAMECNTSSVPTQMHSAIRCHPLVAIHMLPLTGCQGGSSQLQGSP